MKLKKLKLTSLSHLHDRAEEEDAFKEIVDELESDFDELEDED